VETFVCSALELYSDPALVQSARAEFESLT
jgi:hypothetical protein